MMILLAMLLQSAEPACATPVPPPAGLEGWIKTPTLSLRTITPDTVAGVMLVPAGQVTFPVAPERPLAADSYATVLHFTVATAGTYRIALSKGGWIDVVRDGKTVPSAGHVEGLPCSGIRKIVDFALTPGNYDLQISNVTGPSIKVLIATKKVVAGS